MGIRMIYAVRKRNFRIQVFEVPQFLFGDEYKYIHADNKIEAAILASQNWGNYFSPVWVINEYP